MEMQPPYCAGLHPEQLHKMPVRGKERGDLTMPQKFILEIDLGNAGMRSPVNIRDALRAIADKIRYDDELDDLTQKIRDINGNVVGKYEVI